MMFTSDTSFWMNSWKQIKWKLSTYRHKMLTLVAIQLFFVLLGGMGTNSSGISNGVYNIELTNYDLTLYVVIGAITTFIFGTMVGSKSELLANTVIPTTRTTSNFSNSIVLLVVSFLNTVLCFCNLYISAAALTIISTDSWYLDISNLFSLNHFVAVIFFFWMISGIGYLFVSIGGIKWWLSTALLLLIVLVFNPLSMMPTIFEWMVQGGAIWFSLKCLCITLITYLITFVCTKQLEVRYK
jgi:hypothetical protein